MVTARRQLSLILLSWGGEIAINGGMDLSDGGNPQADRWLKWKTWWENKRVDTGTHGGGLTPLWIVVTIHGGSRPISDADGFYPGRFVLAGTGYEHSHFSCQMSPVRASPPLSGGEFS